MRSEVEERIDFTFEKEKGFTYLTLKIGNFYMYTLRSEMSFQ